MAPASSFAQKRAEETLFGEARITIDKSGMKDDYIVRRVVGVRNLP